MTAEAVAPRTTSFGGLRIEWDHRVLEPRAWTVLQARWAADLLDDAAPGPVLELCSGVGHIGLLAVSGTGRRLVCVDVDAAACEYARRNAAAAGLADLVEVCCCDLNSFRGQERYPLVIADPPWVARGDTGRFPGDPLRAIDGGADGLDVARECLAVVDRHLDDGGHALLQVGSLVQVEALESAGLPAGLRLVEARAEPGRGAVALVTRS